MPVCKSCNILKPSQGFQKDSARKSGIRQPCCECMAAIRRKPVIQELTVESLSALLMKSESNLIFHHYIKMFSLRLNKPILHVEDATIEGLYKKAIEILEKNMV